MDPYLKTMLTHVKTIDGKQGCVIAFGRSPIQAKSLDAVADGHATIFHPDTLLDVLCINTKRFPEVVIACEVEEVSTLTISTLVANKQLIDEMANRFVYGLDNNAQRKPFDFNAVIGSTDWDLQEDSKDKSHWQPLLEGVGHFIGLYTEECEAQGKNYIVVYCGIPQTMDEKLDALWDNDNQITVADFIESPLYTKAVHCCRRLARRLAFEFAAHCKLRIQVEQDTEALLESNDHSYPFMAIPTYEELLNVFHKDQEGNIHFYNMCSIHTDNSLYHIHLGNPQRGICISEKVHRTISIDEKTPQVYALFPIFSHHPEYYNKKTAKNKRRKQRNTPVYYILSKNVYEPEGSSPQPMSMEEGWVHRQLIRRFSVMNRSPIISTQ